MEGKEVEPGRAYTPWSVDCHNKIPEVGSCIKRKVLFLMVLKAGKSTLPKIKAQHSVSGNFLAGPYTVEERKHKINS